MDAPIDAKPVIHCLIARRLRNGGFGRSRMVSLETAYFAVQCGGWFAVGPDPQDMEALARWERRNAPFNSPRVIP